MNNLTPEQEIVKLLAQQKLLTDVTLITAALADPEIAEQIIGDIAPNYPGGGEGGDDDGDCEHESLSNEEIQEVFDNDEEQKKEA